MIDVAQVLETIVGESQAHRSVALCAIVATRGSAPQPAGTMLCLDQAAGITGTLGGGCVEADVRRRAHQLLCAGRSGLLTFTLDGDFGFDDGMICGGQMDVAVSVITNPADAQPFEKAAAQLRAGQAATLTLSLVTPEGPMAYRIHLSPGPSLLIAGGGHLAAALARLMIPLGFRVVVIDDRERFANKERFPDPVDAVVGDIAETLSRWPIDPHTFVVIVTRGHKHDEQALQAVLDSPAKYLGMIGSRRKVKVVFDDLRFAGATETQLARVHAPIGLDIQALTTEEIALSIAAELVSVRRALRQKVVEGPIPVARGGS